MTGRDIPPWPKQTSGSVSVLVFVFGILLLPQQMCALASVPVSVLATPPWPKQVSALFPYPYPFSAPCLVETNICFRVHICCCHPGLAEINCSFCIGVRFWHLVVAKANICFRYCIHIRFSPSCICVDVCVCACIHVRAMCVCRSDVYASDVYVDVCVYMSACV